MDNLPSNPLEEKVDKILVLLQHQERRARRAAWWKFFWIIVLVILPMYFSYTMLKSLDISGIMSGAKDAMGTVSELKGSVEDLKEMSEGIPK